MNDTIKKEIGSSQVLDKFLTRINQDFIEAEEKHFNELICELNKVLDDNSLESIIPYIKKYSANVIDSECHSTTGHLYAIYKFLKERETEQ